MQAPVAAQRSRRTLAPRRIPVPRVRSATSRAASAMSRSSHAHTASGARAALCVLSIVRHSPASRHRGVRAPPLHRARSWPIQSAHILLRVASEVQRPCGARVACRAMCVTQKRFQLARVRVSSSRCGSMPATPFLSDARVVFLCSRAQTQCGVQEIGLDRAAWQHLRQEAARSADLRDRRAEALEAEARCASAASVATTAEQ